MLTDMSETARRRRWWSVIAAVVVALLVVLLAIVAAYDPRPYLTRATIDVMHWALENQNLK